MPPNRHAQSRAEAFILFFFFHGIVLDRLQQTTDVAHILAATISTHLLNLYSTPLLLHVHDMPLVQCVSKPR